MDNTRTLTVADHATQTPAPAPETDLETRMAIALAGMDGLLKFKHPEAIGEAQEAVRQATEAAELLTPDLVSFEPNRVLAKARRIIEKRGWHQGSWQAEPGGAVCALKAIELASECNGQAFQEATDELMNRIAVESADCLTIPTWNDRGEQTQEGVCRLLY